MMMLCCQWGLEMRPTLLQLMAFGRILFIFCRFVFADLWICDWDESIVRRLECCYRIAKRNGTPYPACTYHNQKLSPNARQSDNRMTNRKWRNNAITNLMRTESHWFRFTRPWWECLWSWEAFFDPAYPTYLYCSCSHNTHSSRLIRSSVDAAPYLFCKYFPLRFSRKNFFPT